MNNKKVDVKSITIAGLLTALSIIIPLLPLPKIIIGPFTATFAAHVPGILAMFVNPFVVVCTAIGSFIGFAPVMFPVVSLRALTHVFFGLAGYYMLKNNWNIFLVVGITMLIHGASEVVVALFFGNAFTAIWLTTGIFTMIHHCIDFTFAMLLFKALKMANVFDGSINVRSLKA